ncbi:MAG: hypothetical protein RI919_416, partial [Actinomycetota bacterium]
RVHEVSKVWLIEKIVQFMGAQSLDVLAVCTKHKATRGLFIPWTSGESL